MSRFAGILFCFVLLGSQNLCAKKETSSSRFILPPPVWSCIQTVGSDVVLNWVQVPDPGGNFIAYTVNSVEDGLIATIPNITTTSFTHVAVSSIKNYFITVIDNISGPTNGTTLQNIRLTVNNPTNGTALLNWNNSGFSLPIAPAEPIEILREYPAGTWTIQETVNTPVTFYRDTIDICQAFLSYKIEHPGNGCTFSSNTMGDIFADKITPSIPVISNVTIDTLSGNISINWDVNSQPDTYAYIIYKVDAAGFLVELDTVWGRNNTNYTYNDITSNGALTYSVAAFDSCYTTSAQTTFQTSAKGNVHTTTFLTGSYEECGSVAVLDWSNYLGWTDVDFYEVYFTDDASPWQLATTSSGTQYSLLLPNSVLYRIVIQARHADGRTSFSNIISLLATANPAPNINYIATASVENQKVTLVHLVDTSGNVSEIAFERLLSNGMFAEIGKVAVTNPITTFIDENANVENVNSYRVVIIDSCGNRTVASNTAQTIVLSITSDSLNSTNTLNWTPYSGFDGGVSGYEIYRQVDGILSPTPIATVGPNEFTFTDFVEFQRVRSTLCYVVTAIEGINSYFFAESANSNVRCGKFGPTVFIPNAFTPDDGSNSFFQPVFSYMDYPSYEMKITNRWGVVVFETNDSNEAWNGRINGSAEAAGSGMYIYSIRFYGGRNEDANFIGHLTLLR